jgi:hypothetical protein
MHQGVLRDIEREKADQALLFLASSSPSPSTVSSSSSSAAAACESGICDLSKTRFRDPVTGKVVTVDDGEDSARGGAGDGERRG